MAEQQEISFGYDSILEVVTKDNQKLLEEYFMKLHAFAVALAAVVLSTTAAAQTTVPQELRRYNTILVNFSDTAHECNLKDEAMFASYVQEKLAAIGITEDPTSAITVNLAISAKSFGLLSTTCSSQTVMSFNARLGADNIVVDDPEIRSVIDRLKEFPIALHQLGRFGVQAQVQPPKGGESTSTQTAVLKMIDEMVTKLEEQRQ